MGDPAGQVLKKSVYVFKPEDVTIGPDNEVSTPNLMALARFRTSEQYKKDVQFAENMSGDDVRRRLEEAFPALINKRFSCAARAAQNSANLDFHGDRHVWDGITIKRKLKGKSALYIVLEDELSTTTGANGNGRSDSGCSSAESLSLQEQVLEQQSTRTLQPAVVIIHPNRGPVEGNAPFSLRFIANNPICSSVEYLLVEFGRNTVEAGRKRHTNDIWLGETPASDIIGTVIVKIKTPEGNEVGRTLYTYYLDEDEDAMERVVNSTRLQWSCFKEYKEQQCTNQGSRENSTANSSSSGFPKQGLKQQSVHVLRRLVYTAARIGVEQFIRMIFSTSAGRTVFEVYKNESLLPEDIADANGHDGIGAYLRTQTQRFLEENDTNQSRSKYINWPELLRAVEESEVQSGPSQTNNLMKELDEDGISEAVYFGDTEASSDSDKERTETWLHRKTSATAGEDNFPQRLWNMVEDKSYDEIIWWNKGGDGFLICEEKFLASKILPVYKFKHNNYSTFHRQLLNYGFHKRKNGKRTKSYHHDEGYFNRDQPEFSKITRRKKKWFLGENHTKNKSFKDEVYSSFDALSEFTTLEEKGKSNQEMMEPVRKTGQLCDKDTKEDLRFLGGGADCKSEYNNTEEKKKEDELKHGYKSSLEGERCFAAVEGPPCDSLEPLRSVDSKDKMQGEPDQDSVGEEDEKQPEKYEMFSSKKTCDDEGESSSSGPLPKQRRITLEDGQEIMARSPIKAESESDVTQPAQETLDFDDITLRAIAEVYKNEGNDAYGKKDFSNAIYFYTEGIKVKCKDEELNGKLYSNRATAQFYCGNYHDSLSDARAATTLQPTFLKTIVRGASACLMLNQFEEAITWCDKGLSIDKNNKKLLEIRSLSDKLRNKLQDNGGEKEKTETSAVKGKVNHSLQQAIQMFSKSQITKQSEASDKITYLMFHLSIAQADGDKAEEGRVYNNLGHVFQSLGVFNKAVEYHTLDLSIAKDLGDKGREGRAYGNLAIAFQCLGDFNKAIEYHNLYLSIAKNVADKAREGGAYGNLGNAFQSLGDFNKAVEYHILHLSIAKDLGDKAGEGRAYGNLGIAFDSLGDFNKAIEYFTLHLSIAKELGDKAGEGGAYGNLGCAFQSLGDFNKAVEYHTLGLSIAKDLGDKAGEGTAYGNLGNAFQRLGDLNNAIEYHTLHLSIAKDLGDKVGEAVAYGNLGNAFQSLGDFNKAVEYLTLHLSIAKELGDKGGEGRAYGNLGNAFQSIGDFNTAIEYHTLHLSLAKDMGDKAGEGVAYGNLGNAFQSLGDFRKAVEYLTLHLSIAKDLGDKAREGIAYSNLGNAFERLGDLNKAGKCFQASVMVMNDVRRSFLGSRDKWKISFRRLYNPPYFGLYKVLLKQSNIKEALFAAEEGQAQALNDLMEFEYASKSYQSVSRDREEKKDDLLSCTSSSTAFLAIDPIDDGINIWILSRGKLVCHQRKELDYHVSKNEAKTWQSLIQSAYINTGVRAEVRCENRSLDAFLRKDIHPVERSHKKSPQPHDFEGNPFVILYNHIIAPIADLVQGDELIVVPDGPLWLAPYAALLDRNSKYLCESFRIRLIPSLTSLKMITDCSSEYHSSSGALLVGDPYVADITNSKGEKILDQLPFAKKEVEMIGKILKVTPLTGEKATKVEVMKRLRSVALVHIAAHGRMETGEIALTPNPRSQSLIPTKEDYLLTMADVMSLKLRARLVVLSCCHSGREEINPEGVVGIARAFMGAGARSVLVSLWAIDDEATLEFMRSFYHHLVKGQSASQSLNQAMKCLRESDKYSEVKYWAPFVLVGDDVTLQFHENE